MNKNYLTQYLQLEERIDKVVKEQVEDLVKENSSVNSTFGSSVVLISFIQLIISIINTAILFNPSNAPNILVLLLFIGFVILFTIPYLVKLTNKIYIYIFIIFRVFIWQSITLELYLRILYNNINNNIFSMMLETVVNTILVFILVFGALLFIRTILPWNTLILLDHNLINPQKGGVVKIVNVTFDTTKAIDELLQLYKNKRENWNKLLQIANIRDVAKESQMQSLTLFITSLTLLGLLTLLNQSSIINSLITSVNNVFNISPNWNLIVNTVILFLICFTVIVLTYSIYYMQKSIYITKLIQIARLFLTIKAK